MAKTLPEGDPVKGRLIAAYVAQLGVESQRGLKASMVLNLEDAVKKGTVKLTAAPAAELAKVKEATFPSKPPYDQWFANGRTQLNMRHYIRHEFFETDARDYEGLGFNKKTASAPAPTFSRSSTTAPRGRRCPCASSASR